MNTAIVVPTIVTPDGMVFKQRSEGQEKQWEVFYTCATTPDDSLGFIRHNCVSGEMTFVPEGNLVEALGFNHFALSAIAKFIKERTATTKQIVRGQEVEVDADGDYILDGLRGNVQADESEDIRNEKRKRLGLTYWVMDSESVEEQNKRFAATAAAEAASGIGENMNKSELIKAVRAAGLFEDYGNDVIERYLGMVTVSQMLRDMKTGEVSVDVGMSE